MIDVEFEKSKYIDTVKIDRDTYKSVSSLNRRLRSVFGTFSRVLKGRSGLEKTEKEYEIQRLIGRIRQEVIDPILDSSAGMTNSQEAFDLWHRKKIVDIQKVCGIRWDSGTQLTVGMCQKMINLPCKDIWALGLVPEQKSVFFHAVIDAVILHHLLGDQNLSWTKLDSYDTYLRLQTRLRENAKSHSTYPLAAECEGWRKFQ